MSMYSVFGPFEPRDGAMVDSHAKKMFWGGLEQVHARLPRAVGCYVFAIRAAKGSRPWYVGKTEKGSFKGEVWTPHKLLLYNEALHLRKKGKPLLYFIAKNTKGGKFAKPRKGGIGDIRALENLLIGTCLLRNRKLLNAKQTKHLRGTVVPGYMNEQPGARSKPAKELAKLLGT
jgi:hypothetical protein